MKIGLLGFGTVGSGVYEIISKSNNFIIKNIEINKILTRNVKINSKNIMTDNIDEVLNYKGINLVVEAIGGIHPAYEYIMSALKSGKHVVTANKAVVSKYLEEFTQTANKNNVAFLYEASVGGGIPWIKSIKQAKRIDEISEINGIFNGTSNFILYNMFEKGYDFNDILKIAQEKGYAEADPSADIDGTDIQRKLAITSSVAFDTIVKEENIPTFGIRYITKKDIEFFKKHNLTLKLIATSIRNNDEYCSCVEPVLFKDDTIEANVSDNFNIGSLIGESIGELKFYGQGAGKLPTGNAIVQDIIDIYTGGYVNYPYGFNKILKLNQELLKGRYYIRFSNTNTLSILKNVIENFSVNIESIESIKSDVAVTNDTDYAADINNIETVIFTKKLSLKEAQQLFNEIRKLESNLFYARFN